MLRISLASALVLLMTGCAAASGHQQPVSDPRPLGGATALSTQGRDALANATELRIAVCMKARGFAYRPQPSNDQRPDDPSPYALISQSAARVNGYGIVAAVLNHPSTTSEDMNAPVRARLTKRQQQEWTSALVGTPSHVHYVKVTSGMVLHYNDDGCVHLANEQLYGAGWDALSTQVQDDSNAVLQRTTAAPSVTAAVTDWARCMHTAGFAVSHLDDLRGQIQSELTAARTQSELIALGRKELADATADSRCQAQAHLASVITTAQARIQAALPGAVDQRLSIYLRDKAHALGAAKP